VDSAHPPSGRADWVRILGAIGAILLPLAFLFSFFTSDDSGATPAEVIAYAENNSADLWFMQIVALLVPLAIGLFVASLWVRLRLANEVYRALTVIGGTLFIAFLSTGLTLWAAPLLSSDELTDAGADAYLTFDDAGWVMLGLGGVSIGLMIIGVSLAALEHRWVPKWAGWVSLALGVVSLATIVAVGFFAWAIWLIAAGCFLLFRRDPVVSPAGAPRAL
jgi:hypothetical protein